MHCWTQHQVKKNSKIKGSLYSNAVVKQPNIYEILKAGSYAYEDQTWNSLNPMIKKFAVTNSYHPTIDCPSSGNFANL